MVSVLDYKKEYKELYSPKNQPMIIEVPEIIFVAVEGRGNPNDENGEYSNALKLLYGIQYTIKNPRRKQRGIEDFSLKYLRMRGNKSPAPPGSRPKGRG
ncbi:MAG: GyrI-like domain-containing protein, partial [Treponema sp.]|nr:GyrI-like domain-containing protein [Treponema sp.]